MLPATIGSPLRLLVPDVRARGRFSLGDLPAGSQVLEVRRNGYLLAHHPVELRAGRTHAQEIRLQRMVAFDPLRVLAQRSRYRELEERRKRNGIARFHPSCVGAIEAHAAGGPVPPQYDGHCGVIVIWTKR